MERYIAIARENRKYNMRLPFLVCMILLLASPLVIGVKNLTEMETAKVLEYYLIFLGVILLPPVFLAEQNRDIRDLIAAKHTPMAEVYLIRIIQAMLALMLLTGIYLMAMRLGNCEFSFGKLYAGTLSGMLFLGSLGVLSYGITDQIVIGYMVPVLYYMLNISAGYEKMGLFYLFSMCVGEYEPKWCLAGMGILMLVLGVVIRVRRK